MFRAKFKAGKLVRLALKAALAAALIAVIAYAGRGAIRAQQELLQNPSMDLYTGSPYGVTPVGWSLVVSGGASSSKQDWVFNEFPGFTTSWKVSASRATFTMTAYQTVIGVRAGTKLRFSAYANVFTCDKETSCIEEGKPRQSMQESQARVRIGIDTTGGTDPNGVNVQWSGFIAPYDQFAQLVIDTEVKADSSVTVFLFATQSVAMLLNDVYWDNASLIIIGPGQVGGPLSTEVPRVVPFVTPQGQQADGSVVHIVREGDTLASIAVAYNVSVADIRKLNNIPPDEYVIRPGQRLIIKPPSANVTYVVVTATHTPDPNQPTPTPNLAPQISPTPRLQLTRAVTIITLAPYTPRAQTTFGPIIPTNTRRSSGALAATDAPTAVAQAVADMTTAIADLPTSAPTAAAPMIATAMPTETPAAPPIPAEIAAEAAANPTAAVVAKVPEIRADIPVVALAGAGSTDEAGVCVTAFDDVNTNRLHDSGEALLTGVVLRLTQGGQEVQTLTTENSVACLTGLAPGAYTLTATPPEGYGLTTPGQLRLEMNQGAWMTAVFGAAGGYRPTPVITAPEALPPPLTGSQRPESALDAVLQTILQNSGLLVLGLAGVVLVGGVIFTLLTRRV